MGYIIPLTFMLTALFFCTSNAQNNGDLRLSGTTLYSGRIEVFYNGEWGTVCDDRFDANDAKVVCKQLNYGPHTRIVTRAGFGRGSGRIWMDGLGCTGNEEKLMDCPFNGWGKEDCSHAEDVGVTCEEPEEVTIARETIINGNNNGLSSPVRLACPPEQVNSNGDCNVCFDKEGCPSASDGVKGIVEIQINNTWIPISGKSWTSNEATVACGQLGFPVAHTIPKLSTIWPSLSAHFCYGAAQNNPNCQNRVGVSYRRHLRTTILQDIQCSGLETNLTSCSFSAKTITPSLEGVENVALVHCGYKSSDNSEHCIEDSNKQKETYRLRAGIFSHVGRVEVRVNGAWGTICDLGWDVLDANVVCRNLGFGTAKRIFTRSSFGRGIGPTHFSNLRCNGDESALSKCIRTPAGNAFDTEVTRYCREHTGDVGVECNAPLQCPADQLSRIVSNDIVELDGQIGWGQICEDTIDIDAATVVCRETQQLFANKISTTTGTSNIYYKGSVQCNGDETRISKCKISLSSVSRCEKGVVKVECTAKLPDLVPIIQQFRESLERYPYIDNIPMFYLTCAKEENCLASTADNKPPHAIRRLLRFNSLTMNYGTIDFTPVLDRSNWLWHACHNHYHSYENFITYDVLNNEGKEVAEGHKASFCLEDSQCDHGGYSRYRCSTGHQGISMNCGDLYARHLDCQWIDVTDVGNGVYNLRQTINADRLTPETDYKNNEIECTIRIRFNYYLSVIDCRHSDH